MLRVEVDCGLELADSGVTATHVFKPRSENLVIWDLKLYQRRVVRDKGVDVMLWTYDPLVARNAYLNICRLGALPVEYVRDLYGPDTASDLHRGLGTDRFVVAWRLDATDRPVTGSPAEEAWASSPILNLAADGSPLEEPPGPDGEVYLRIAIPSDVQAEKARDAASGALWRLSTRRDIEASLAAGYLVAGFERDHLSERCWYLLGRGESG